MAIESEALLTVQEVAQRLHLHSITVRRLIKAGRLPAIRLGRSVRVRESDLEALIRGSAAAKGRLPPWPPTPEEIERRTRLMKETFARRDRRGPIGFSTLELIRASRAELEERAERR